MELTTIISCFACFVFAAGTVIYMKIKKPSFKQIAKRLKEPLLQLFLYAEKQEWTGAEKMEWCIDQLLEILPIKIKVDEVTLRIVAQYLYDEYREFIIRVLDDEQEEKA